MEICKKKFSIITPMYNSYKHMNRYLASLQNQEYKNFEVIVVDDCSTDSSFELLKANAPTVNLELRIIKTEANGGPGRARNLGVSVATGEFIVFIDSDDYIATNTLSVLNDNLGEEIDILYFDYFRERDNKFAKCSSIQLREGELWDKEKILLNTTTTVWGKVFRRNTIVKNNIVFPSLKRFEDWVFLCNAIIHANKISCIKEHLYYYVDNSDSIVHIYNNEASNYSRQAFDMLKDKLERHSYKIAEALFAREILYVYAKDNITKLPIKVFRENVSKLEKMYPDWRRNASLSSFSFVQMVVLKLLSYKCYRILKLAACFFL